MTNEKTAPLSRTDVSSAIAAKLEISTVQADAVVREYEASIVRAVSAGQEVRLLGFGSFKVQERAARTGRNPRTGQQQEFPAKKVAKFTPSKVMKDALASNDAETAKAKSGAKGEKAAPVAKKPRRKLGSAGHAKG